MTITTRQLAMASRRFRTNLQYAVRERGAKAALAKTTGLTPVYISILLHHPNITPSLRVALLITNATGYTINDFLCPGYQFRRIVPQKQPAATIAAFLENLDAYLKVKERGTKAAISHLAQISPIYLSRLLRAVQDQRNIDIGLHIAIKLANAIQRPLSQMVVASENFQKISI